MNGGKRPGAGRPAGTTKPGSRTSLVAVRLTDEERACAEKIGNGSTSAGIRRALNAFGRRRDAR